ncbi:MAG: hypothetical protein ACP5H5_10160 [Pyrobaculum sp.]
MSGELGVLAQEALRVAVESVLGKLREGKKLSTEDIFLLYLATIGKELDEIRREIAEVNQRIDQTNRRIDMIAQELGRRIDETNKRIDGVYALLLDIQKLLVEIARKS